MHERFGDKSGKYIRNPKDYSGSGEVYQTAGLVDPRSPYLILRQEVRSLLWLDGGIPSNPGWGNWEIVNAFRSKAGLLPSSEPWDDESDEKNDEFFEYRYHLIRAIREAGVEIKEPISEVNNIIEGLALLLRK
ncbi:hypothetical protein A3F00_02640 [Candidatus Daviesbacteria bacterium RIFCSPHIGHO2_12_FULL_37_11]|uniref:Uncharacterized protein n=1 Tax=Candidatus Daviesbacteria bacterium RIFCSPHIGHO2_12_FULL_37_11 TaxID=1797777 RepID=A0A1F5KEF8_9BACT|nr:MAG: hypothetical protein A2769_02465 [Candidatus Daviesbacteria bacterium RIFCSPHIGHO2_01_FULL_37_27]OGE39333.1 MAG: hypothetical protein A3F00_02640 [Candidatus Daviesbacteria bacterium RIFCSPHIGHO2_12_FULL_37_11]OGE45129.1 MAG: hypothetical protein A3B39_01810 [Candidatus Daviesbacteria bacterium RIFCSPLOWO2_01_FULL_37_10]